MTWLSYLINDFVTVHVTATNIKPQSQTSAVLPPPLEAPSITNPSTPSLQTSFPITAEQRATSVQCGLSLPSEVTPLRWTFVDEDKYEANQIAQYNVTPTRHAHFKHHDEPRP